MILSQSRYKPDVCFERFMEQQKTSVSMSGDTAEILNRQQFEFHLETCRYTNTFGELIYKYI